MLKHFRLSLFKYSFLILTFLPSGLTTLPKHTMRC
nr:MAG TPA: hypothetical protein [Caudoviricetes sp.]